MLGLRQTHDGQSAKLLLREFTDQCRRLVEVRSGGHETASQTLHVELQSRQDDGFAWPFNQIQYTTQYANVEFGCHSTAREQQAERTYLLLQNGTRNKTLFFHIIPPPLALFFSFHSLSNTLTKEWT